MEEHFGTIGFLFRHLPNTCGELSRDRNMACMGPAKLPNISKSCPEGYSNRLEIIKTFIGFDEKILFKVWVCLEEGVLRAERGSAK